MSKRIDAPETPERGVCEPEINKEPIKMPDEAPIAVPVSIPVEVPVRTPA